MSADDKPFRRQRGRVLSVPACYATQTDRFGSVTVLTNRPRKDFITETQVTVSENHDWPRSSKGNLRDVGGDFYTQRKYIENWDDPLAGVPRHYDISYVQELFPGVKTTYRYTGPILTINPWSPNSSVAFPADHASSNSQLDTLGATAVARCKPTKSIASASTFLGELIRDGLPTRPGVQAWRNRAALARGAGSEYLNVVFGWLPLVNDVADFGNAIIHANAVLEQFERDAGKVVRRQYHFPTTHTTSETVKTNSVRAYGPENYQFWSSSALGQIIVKKEIIQKRWFSGAFTYHLPDGGTYRQDMIRAAREAKKIAGLTFDPETLWSLTPWSWGVDWFTNAGDVLSNLRDWATDDLVMRYGYMMEHTIVKETHMAAGSYLPPRGRDPVVLPVTLVTETKQRRRANPFGFGLNFDGLSGRQVSILAALGISRHG